MSCCWRPWNCVSLPGWYLIGLQVLLIPPWVLFNILSRLKRCLAGISQINKTPTKIIHSNTWQEKLKSSVRLFSSRNEQTSSLVHLVSGSQVGGGGEAEFQGEGVGAVCRSERENKFTLYWSKHEQSVRRLSGQLFTTSVWGLTSSGDCR